MDLDNTAAKTAAKGAVDQAGEALIELSHLVHGHPELAFEEVESSKFTADALAGAGFAIDFGVCDLPTAFVARVGSGPLHVGICAEYDALPDIGHACGHNRIASTASSPRAARRPTSCRPIRRRSTTSVRRTWISWQSSSPGSTVASRPGRWPPAAPTRCLRRARPIRR